jgi:hypothetical protein
MPTRSWEDGAVHEENGPRSGSRVDRRIESRALAPEPTDRRPVMSDAAENATPAEEQESHSGFWPDETVDMFAALVVVTAVVLACLWYVTGS